MWLFYLLSGAVAVLLGTLLVRAANFRPALQPKSDSQPISFHQDGAIAALQQLIQCRTVSNSDAGMDEEAEFEKFYHLLPKLYPLVFEQCSVQRFPERGLLFCWPGASKDAPSVMMAHYDVVDADESQWKKPPFQGIIEDGHLWGRGTLDTKATFNGILYAANHLMEQGFIPHNDIYFAFSGSEEVNGQGAKHIVNFLQDNNIHPALVLDEGGAVVENVFPGVHRPCALVGVGEKGMMNVEYSVNSSGGHASAPPPQSPVELLSRACLQVKSHPFRMKISPAAKALFNTLGRHSGFFYKIIFANLGFFRPVLDLICRRTGGELDALVRTTTAFTQMEGSQGRNVLPTQARMICNMRLNPGDTVAHAEAYLKKIVNDSRVDLQVLEGFEASPISRTDCHAYRLISSTISQLWPQAIISPYLMVQCSDARHYGSLSDRVYRFCPMELTAEERKTIHGNNERIPLKTITKTVEFYIRLMQQC